MRDLDDGRMEDIRSDRQYDLIASVSREIERDINSGSSLTGLSKEEDERFYER